MLDDISAVRVVAFGENSPLIVCAGENLGESQLRYDQDVSSRSFREAPRHSTFPVRLHPSIRRTSATSFQ